jgi:hypothetical protein
MSDSPTI